MRIMYGELDVGTWSGCGNSKRLIVEERPNAQHTAASVVNTDREHDNNLGSENHGFLPTLGKPKRFPHGGLTIRWERVSA